MKLAEYATMYNAEDHHWWYRGLRQMLLMFWKRHVAAECPRLLDIGCGTGANLAALAGASEPFGIDFEPEAVRFCRTRGLDDTVAASALQLPFQAESFDVVISCDVLCHSSIPDKSIALQEMRRVLSPGGLVFLNLPAYQWLLSSHDQAYQQDQRFTRPALAKLLSANGFDLVAATYWNTLLFPIAATARLWRKMTRPKGSDFNAGSAQSAAPFFNLLLGIERTLISCFPMPFGLSVFTVARRH
jgi:ubiquinone/menaquinone biosynthesis C-methylase UbiE